MNAWLSDVLKRHSYWAWSLRGRSGGLIHSPQAHLSLYRPTPQRQRLQSPRPHVLGLIDVQGSPVLRDQSPGCFHFLLLFT